MPDLLVKSAEPVTVLGGGAVREADLTAALRLAPRLVAADGGADAALRFGHVPDAVIGDMDSMSDAARQVIPTDRIHHIAEQDSTDFDKCLRSVEAPVVLALGFTGARLDHQLAALTSLVRHPWQVCIMVGEQDVVFRCPKLFAMDMTAGERVSLYPLSVVKGTSTGLRWPIDGVVLSSDARVGTSNEALGGPVTIRPDTDGLLVILPRDRLDDVVSVLSPA